MTANQATYPIETMAKTLGVSRSGFYAWSSRSPSARSMADGDLTGRIKTIHQASRQIYGAPRIHAELADAGIHVVNQHRSMTPCEFGTKALKALAESRYRGVTIGAYRDPADSSKGSLKSMR